MKHCPSCNVEYQERASRCSDCDVALEPGSPAQEQESHPDITLECVYATGDPALIPIVKSLLDDAEIEYLAKGDGIQDLFGWGRFGSGLNFVIGPVEFFVASEEAAAAREIVSHLSEVTPDAPPEDEWGT